MNTTVFQPPRLARSWALVIAAMALLAPRAVEAAALIINDPIYIASQSPAPPHAEAGSVAHIFENSITLANASFFPGAWSAWTAPFAPGTWTLVDGGALPGLTFTVSVFEAFSNHRANHNPTPGSGGVDIRIDVNYNGADRNELFWTQGLYDNYLLDGSIVDPFYEMDVSTALGVHPAPLYPLQFVDQRFLDTPAGPFDGAFFEADAFLCKIDRVTGTLTLYDGVEYGFYLYVVDVPEPATWVLMFTALAAMTIAAARAAATSRRR